MNMEREKLSTNVKLKMTDQQIQQQKIREESKRTNAMTQVAKINNKVKEKNKK
jgi:hypothetical protein